MHRRNAACPPPASRALLALSAVSCLALAACGGGGGGSGGITPISTPTTTTTPSNPATPITVSPVTTPTGQNYDTDEYARSNGAVQANAITAYNIGATGRGVTVDLVDSGIDTSSAEFAGRISSASADLVANRGIQDEGGHGTAVAGVLGAAMNGSGIEGIAFESTLLVARTDAVGSCGTNDGCEHSDTAIAKGIDLATEQHARIINISLGGSVAGQQVLNAVDRATAQGIIIVMAGGNDGTANPDDFALSVANAGVARGLVIIAGATDGTGDIANFSNRAGTGSTHYLLALGDRVRSFDNNGAAFLYSGTSFSTPLIAGAAALLAQAFPTLTGAQIVKILFSTARDGGAAGVDTIYGNGILDLARAFQPQGPLSLAGSAVAVTGDNGALSTAMGDATGSSLKGAGAGAVMLDGYGRAYRLDLGSTLRRDAPARRLAPALRSGLRSFSGAAGGAEIAVTVSAQGDRPLIERLLLSPGEVRAAHATAGLIAARLGDRAALAVGFGQGGAALGGRLAGEGGDPFLVALDPLAGPGFERRPGSAAAVRRAFGSTGVTFAAEEGQALTPSPRLGEEDRRLDVGHRYSALSLALDRRFGPLTLSGGATRLIESGTVLGARFGAFTGSKGAVTDFVDAGASLAPGGGWRLAARARRGWTTMPAGGVAVGGRLASGGYALDLTQERAFGGRLSLRFAEPLRVRGGGYDLLLPTAYDYDNRSATTSIERLGLAPRGRERDAEAAWETRLGPGAFTANLYWRRDPGNIAALADDLGGALRFTMGF